MLVWRPPASPEVGISGESEQEIVVDQDQEKMEV